MQIQLSSGGASLFSSSSQLVTSLTSGSHAALAELRLDGVAALEGAVQAGDGVRHDAPLSPTKPQASRGVTRTITPEINPIDSLIRGASHPKLSSDSHRKPDGGLECDYSMERYPRSRSWYRHERMLAVAEITTRSGREGQRSHSPGELSPGESRLCE